ncbi:MAG: SpaH/EbpB family LPXTG-anchored major pilin [Lachnospiraceae bacterium]|nr:SpaH/EbpB family LPXTG-anchored major pilin [Lachnospiraceae bacterium]
MKKLKKLLAGVLTLAMAMSMMTMTVSAANDYTGQEKSLSTIDTSKSGSLTIYKYEVDEIDENGTPGTGAASDKPTDKELLDGVEFTIYRVMTTQQMLDYYSGAEGQASLPKVDDYVNAPVAPSKAWTVKNASTTPEVAKKVTGADGTKGAAVFSDLELGIYLVIETGVPDAVTTSVKPFLVSIPMTTVEGDNWLYDVEVFPKNETAYGGLELEKLAITGGDKDDAEPLAGVTFKLFKKDANAEGGWKEITAAPANGEDNAGTDYTLVTGTNGKISIEGLTSGDYYFVEYSLGETGEKNGYILDQKTHYEFTVNGSTITFPNGADYVATDSSDSSIQWIKAYNDKPDVDKEVKDRESEEWVNETDYNYGDTIPYQVTIKVPANIADLKEFKLTDTPVGLQDDINSIKIKCDTTDLVINNDYTVAASGAGFVITFDTNQNRVKATAGKEIVITYNATLTADAAVTTPENPNTVKLEYSNEILPDSDPKTPGKKEIHDGAVVYSFAIKIDKVNDEGDKLEGVQFDLYREASESETGAALGSAFAGAGLDSNKYYVKVNGNTPLETDANGNITQTGLADGIYWLVETKTVDGYNLLKAPVRIELDYEYETRWTEETEYDSEGKLIKQVWSSVTITKDGSEVTDAQDLRAGTLLETVVNKHGFELPTTGGMGTFLFTFVGVAMMAAAVILFFTSKKKEAK